MTLIQQLCLILAGLAAGATVAVAVRRMSFAPAPAKALEAYQLGGEAVQSPDDANINIRLGLLKPGYARLAQGLTFAPGLVLALLGYPLILAVGLSGLAFILTDEYLKGKPRRVRAQIEEELPPFLSRLSGSLAVTDAVRRALDDALRSLPETSPLAIWLDHMLRGMGREGAAFYHKARSEAVQVSPMLAIVVYQLSRLSETGGSGFSDAFTILAEELGARQEARAIAGAKAGAARQAVLMMLGIMAGIMVLILGSPSMRHSFSQPIAQLTAIICFAVMGFGYVYLNGMIADALE
jgi:hypothetical protein